MGWEDVQAAVMALVLSGGVCVCAMELGEGRAVMGGWVGVGARAGGGAQEGERTRGGGLMAHGSWLGRLLAWHGLADLQSHRRPLLCVCLPHFPLLLRPTTAKVTPFSRWERELVKLEADKWVARGAKSMTTSTASVMHGLWVKCTGKDKHAVLAAASCVRQLVKLEADTWSTHYRGITATTVTMGRGTGTACLQVFSLHERRRVVLHATASINPDTASHKGCKGLMQCGVGGSSCCRRRRRGR